MSKLTVLVAARDEADRIGRTVERLRAAFPDAEVVVAEPGRIERSAGKARRVVDLRTKE